MEVSGADIVGSTSCGCQDIVRPKESTLGVIGDGCGCQEEVNGDGVAGSAWVEGDGVNSDGVNGGRGGGLVMGSWTRLR